MDFAKTIILDNKICAEHINYALFDNPKIGVQFFDASGKIPDGLFSGHIVSLGHYDQCLNISEMSPLGPIKGKYCLVKIMSVLRSYAGYGVCIPETCDYKLGLEEEVVCQTKDSYSTLDDADCWFLIIIGLLGFIMLLSTLYDLYTRKFELNRDPTFIIFSVITNGEKLFETQIAPDQISCLAGLRVLSMFWIIFSHRYYMFYFMPLKNGLYGFELLFSHRSFYIQAAYLAVDTFLFIGGFVLAYQCFKYRNKLSLTWRTIPYFYMHRLLRLVPLMAIIFFIQLSIIRRLGDGPMYSEVVETMRRPCIDHWWSYFFFTQNYEYQRVQDQCLTQTWYVNVDIQLYLFTPLIIIPTTKLLQENKILKCYCVFFLVLLLSIIIPIFFLFAFEYRYQHTHTRISPYIIGLIMGLFMVENKDKTFKIGNKLYIVTWLLAIASMLFCTYYIQNVAWMSFEVNINKFANYMFISFGRPAWCFGLSWIVFCCSTKNADALNKVLSNKLFLVVSRLSYSMYLLHVFVILLSMATTRTTTFLTFFWMFHGCISDIVITALLSIIFVLAFESPIIALVKLLLSRRESQLVKNM